MRKLNRVIGLAFALLLWARPAHAIDEEAARRHFEKATDAFSKKAYDLAASEYLLAYKATNDASLLYNVGQAHRLGGHASAALQYLRMYLQNTPDAADRDEVTRQMDTLERELAQQKAAQIPVKAPEPALQPPATPEPPAPVAVVERPGRTKKIAGLVVGIAGIALLAGGIACGVLAQNASDALTRANRAGEPFDPAKEREGQNDQIAEGVLLGVGAAALVTGVVVHVLGHREARVRVAPSFSSRGAGASLSFAF